MLKSHINRLLIAVVLVNVCAIIGCHRSYYRRQADAVANRLIREKSVDPRWNTATGNIQIDPQSRMFDPFSQDHPPIPPDDPSSHQLMHSVDGKEGFPQWHANGDTNYVENPEWRSYLPINEQGQCVLNLERAFQLALIHSPDFQRQREALYLSALDVSLQRFGFDSQLFGGSNNTLGLGRGNTFFRNSLGVGGGGFNLERLGTTGSTFMLGLANTILFNFGGGDSQTATSLIDFSIVQPLLRGAGRDRIMESLTQSERDLLANIRQLARFRRGFYLDIAVGRNPGISVNSSLLSLPGIAGSAAGGFIGLLQDQQIIRNQELNVRQQEAVLKQFRELFLRERLDARQLKRFENSFYRQQRNLANVKTRYQNSLDQFKMSLGLPPNLDVVIEDEFLDQFKLISDQVNEQLITIQDLREEMGVALNVIDESFEDLGEPEFQLPANLADLIEGLASYVETAQKELDKIINEDRLQLESDFKKLEASRPRRLAYLNKLSQAIEAGEIPSDIDVEVFEAKSIPEAAELRIQLENPELDNTEFIINEDGEQETPPRSILKRADILKQEFVATKSAIASFRQQTQDMTAEQVFDVIVKQFQEKIPGQLTELNTLLLELSLLQAKARSNSIEITDVEIRAEQAIRIARCLRRDWMNARASLVDSWRNIEFVADQLESQVDLIFEGNMSNDGNNPFKLRYETGQLRGGLRFDLPIVRMSERNQYRQALISYQQTRRQFYQFEDSIKQNVRQIIRNVDQSKVLFELDRRTVQISIDNLEVNRFDLDKPVAPGGSLRLSDTTAQNLSDAIIELNNSQNSFVSSWVQMEVLRRSLDYDMGTMQLNEMGEWIDPGEIGVSIGIRAAAIMGIDLESECQFCENIGTPYSSVPYGDQSPAFDQTPTDDADTPLNQPQQPTLEPVPDQTPKTETPTVPDIPKSLLNEPPSKPDFGMLNPKSDSPAKTLSQVPSLLFQPVKVRPAAKPKVVENQPPQPLNHGFAKPEKDADSADVSNSETTKLVALPTLPYPANVLTGVDNRVVPEPPVATPVNWEESVDAPETSDASEMVRLKAVVEKVIPGSLMGRHSVELKQEPIEASTATGTADLDSTGEASGTSWGAVIPIKAAKLSIQNTVSGTEETNSKPAISRLRPMDSPRSKTFDTDSAFEWQSRPSSLGGLLYRFQTKSSPKNTFESSKN